LQDSVFQAGIDVQQLRGRDVGRASQLQTQLDDLRDEVIYLKVKLRKEGTLPRTEYSGVRDRIDDVRSQATNYTATYTPGNGNGANGATSANGAGAAVNRPATTPSYNTGGSSASTSTPPSTTASAAASTTTPRASTTQTATRDIEVPSGTEMDVRLTNNL